MVEAHFVPPTDERVQVRFRIPTALYKELQADAERVGVPFGSFLGGVLAVGLRWRHTEDAPAKFEPVSKSQARHQEVHQRNEPEEEVDLTPYAEEKVLQQVQETYSPEPGSRHWHRIDNRKRENAVKTWFNQGEEMGEFACECGKLVKRTVQR